MNSTKDVEIKVKGKNMADVGDKIASATGKNSNGGTGELDIEFLIKQFDDSYFVRIYKIRQGRNWAMAGRIAPSQFSLDAVLESLGPGHYRFQVIDEHGKIKMAREHCLGEVDEEEAIVSNERVPVSVSGNNDILGLVISQNQQMVQMMLSQQTNQSNMFAQLMSTLVTFFTGMHSNSKSDIDHLEQLSNVQKNLLEATKPSSLFDDLEKLEKLRSFLDGGGPSTSSLIKEGLGLAKDLINEKTKGNGRLPAGFKISSADVPPAGNVISSPTTTDSNIVAPNSMEDSSMNTKLIIDKIMESLKANPDLNISELFPLLLNLNDTQFVGLYEYLFATNNFESLKKTYPFLESESEKFSSWYAQLKIMMENELELGGV